MLLDEPWARCCFFGNKLNQHNPVALHIGLIVGIGLQNIPAIKAGAIVSSQFHVGRFPQFDRDFKPKRECGCPTPN